jgi:hypothetical protein
MSNNRPTHRAFITRDYEDAKGAKKTHWTQIGSVWAHKDGKGFDVTLTAFPVDGRLAIRLDEPKPVTATGGGAQ